MNKINGIEYELYCLYHNKVFKKYYGNQINDITFVKMGNSSYYFKTNRHVALFKELYFEPIGKEWAEYEFYYSLYKGYNKGLVKLPEYLGFIQYDMEFVSKTTDYDVISVIDFIDMTIKAGNLDSQTIISFNPGSLTNESRKGILTNPEGMKSITDSIFKNYMCSIIDEYNALEKKSFRYTDIPGGRLSMCGAFFIHRDIFLKMMKFLSIIIEDKRLEPCDKTSRMQGQFAERYVAIFLAGSSLKTIEFPLVHHFTQTSYMSLTTKISIKISKVGGILKSFIDRFVFHKKKSLL